MTGFQILIAILAIAAMLIIVYEFGYESGYQFGYDDALEDMEARYGKEKD